MTSHRATTFCLYSDIICRDSDAANYLPSVNPLSFFYHWRNKLFPEAVKGVSNVQNSYITEYLDSCTGTIKRVSKFSNNNSQDSAMLLPQDQSDNRVKLNKINLSHSREKWSRYSPAIITSLDAEKKPGLFDQTFIPGPWFVFLLVNMEDRFKPRIHTITGITNMLPGEVEDTFNNQEKNPYTQTHKHIGKWALILAATGFESWEQAKNYFYIWNTGTRGKMSRTMMGIVMFERFKEVHPWLKVYSVALPKDQRV